MLSPYVTEPMMMIDMGEAGKMEMERMMNEMQIMYAHQPYIRSYTTMSLMPSNVATS